MNTPDTEVTTGDPQTSHASAVIKYPTPDTEFDSDKEIVGSDCLCVLGSKKHNPECEYAEHSPDTEWEVTPRPLHISAKALYECAMRTQALLTSRDTYWKERVRKEINEISRHWIEEATRNPDNFEVRIKLDALDTLLDNLK